PLLVDSSKARLSHHLNALKPPLLHRINSTLILGNLTCTLPFSVGALLPIPSFCYPLVQAFAPENFPTPLPLTSCFFAHRVRPALISSKPDFSSPESVEKDLAGARKMIPQASVLRTS